MRKNLTKMDEEDPDLEEVEVERRTLDRPELFKGMSFGFDAALAADEKVAMQAHIECAGGRVTGVNVAGRSSWCLGAIG